MNTLEQPVCLICRSANLHSYYYPPVIFNKKTFTYLECPVCLSAVITPLPNEEDFREMYGESDHAYLLKLKEDEKLNFTFLYEPYNHQKYQLDFFNKYNYGSAGKTLLDIGCGSGFYMKYAEQKGLECYGIEFDEKFVSLLIKKTNLKLSTFKTFEKEFVGKTFDLIHIGHMLEHSINPDEVLAFAKKYSHENTILIIDGPLEKNKCLSRWLIKTVSKLKRKKHNTYPPQHITFTNYNSQLRLFERNNLKKLNYEVAEQMFPLPNRFTFKHPLNSVLFLIARSSVNLSKLHPKLGNLFHYAGRFN